MKNFDEFVHRWQTETRNIKIKNEYRDLLFLVFWPDNQEWTFSAEKETQTTTLMVSGGVTGAGTGHDVQFCYRSQIHDRLLRSDHTHAMIVSAGMVFDMVNFEDGRQVTPITDFFDFVESGEFCKAHIIARPNEPVFLHYQHMNLNLDKWRELYSPNMNQRWTNYTRSPDNFHDDYTPYWVDIEGLPRIENFTHAERRRKAFSYFRDHDDTWKNIMNRPEEIDEYYFSRFTTRIFESYYIFNTETLRETPDKKFDVIFSPTAGYSAEANCHRLNFDKKVVLYDYNQTNLDIKKNIVEMNMSLDEIHRYRDMTKLNMVSNIENSPSHERAAAMGTFEELRQMQAEMYDKCDVEYWLMDLIKPDYEKILETVKDKVVFFDSSNIFSYHVCHAVYGFDELVDAYYNLHEVLSQAKECWFQGTKPTKQWERIWI